MTPKERLLLLADRLDADAANPNGMKFDLLNWFSDETVNGYDSPTQLKPDCNTTGCAIGLAMLTPEFNAEGFKAEKYVFDPEFGDDVGWVAVGGYFELTRDECERLFQCSFYPEALRKGVDGERAVAARIRDFLAAIN